VYTGKFDVVTCLDILDRIPDPLGELNGIHETLKDDGILLVRVPNFGSEIAEGNGISWHHNRPWEKIYQFDYSRLKNLLDKSGFKIIDLKTELSDGVGSPGSIIMVGMKKIWTVQKNAPRILVIREGAAGDVLLTTPILKKLKRKLPGSYITFMTRYPEILQHNPYVDEITEFESKDGVDVVFNLMYELYPDIPIIEAYGEITQLSLRNPEIEFYPSPDEHAEVDRLLKRLSIENTKGFVVIHPIAGSRMKSWHKANYQAVSDHIGSKKLTSVTVGSPMDCVELKGATNLIGRLSMRQSAALISRARLFMGLDSFPMHIANAFEIPSVILFGSTDPSKILVDGRKVRIVQSSEHCLGCRHDTTPDRWKQNVDCRREKLYCMEYISADCVMEKIDETLKSS
jgi:ADP-heptose:LPS heptosyltransferase